ncbi:hypothetical protein QQF64_034281 [Cirrhinus molitorella]|uniref:Pao retrotransposon peptidase n=1 Tax=Cirrhinus molitorella TaxID=172907 RepID=A0ABR3L4T9_9TELE
MDYKLKDKWSNSNLDFTQETEAHGSLLKVLGLVWRPDTDDFVFDSKHLMNILKGKDNTKRSVLRSSAQIFDPIGFLTPFTIRVKCLFQEMWRQGLGWDEELPPELSQAWQQWCMELPQIHQIVIPRWYGTNELSEQSQVLHVFTDASEKAYGAVGYLQGQTSAVTRLVASKSRVAAIETITLPRLELMGALIGARLASNLLKALNLQPTQLYMWSDSMIVIYWIRSSAQKWKQFVANRVVEIQQLTPPELWSHCNGKMNPADLITRGQSASKLKEDDLWWSGPPFLKSEPPIKEPEFKKEGLLEQEVNVELKARRVTVQFSNSETLSDPILQLEKYSKLQTVLRVTAWIKRFVFNCRSKEKRTGELTAEELSHAEAFWIHTAQVCSFDKEISEIKTGQNVHKRTQKSESLNLSWTHGYYVLVVGCISQT